MYLELLIAFIAVLLTWFKIKIRKYESLNKFPGPSTIELIHAGLTQKTNKAKYEYIVNLSGRFGDVVKLWVKPFKPVLVVSDPKFVEAILLSKDFIHKPEFYKNYEPVIGLSLFTTTDDNLWRTERRIMSPLFKSTSIIKYTMFYQEHSDTMVNYIKTHEGQPVDIQRLAHQFSINVMLELLFNEKIEGKSDEVNKYLDSVDTFIRVSAERSNSMLKKIDAIFKFTKGYEELSEANRCMFDFIKKLYDKQMNCLDNSEEVSTFFKDFANTGLGHDRIFNQLRTLLPAGSDTLGQAISFTFYLLAKRPDVQQKILDEYNAIVSGDTDASFDDIQSMRYTECVAKEALRLYPPIPIIQRGLPTDINVDGTVIPSGITIVFSSISMQTSKNYYRQPLDFKPERFLSENAADLHANAFVPFAAGPRNCIGWKFAMNELKFIITYLVKRFTVEPVEHEMNVFGEFALRSANGIFVKFKARDLS